MPLHFLDSKYNKINTFTFTAHNGFCKEIHWFSHKLYGWIDLDILTCMSNTLAIITLC